MKVLIYYDSVMRQRSAGYFLPLYPHTMTIGRKEHGVYNLPASSGVRIWILLLAIVLLAAEDESALPKRNDMVRAIKKKKEPLRSYD